MLSGGAIVKGLYGRLRIREAMLVISVCAIVLAFVSVACDSSNALTEKEVSESLATFALRAYGETQEAYQYNNWQAHYGDWDSLVEGHFISEGYNRGNIIKNYSMWTGVFNLPIYGSSVYAPSTFTGVAFPRPIGPPGYLSTFSIREDRILRIYVPDVAGMNAWNENGDCGTKTWEKAE
jgi:hypothetical protein